MVDPDDWSLRGELLEEESESFLDLDLELDKGEEPESSEADMLLENEADSLLPSDSELWCPLVLESDFASVSTSLSSASLSLERSEVRSLYSPPGVLARLVRNWHSSDVKAAFSGVSFRALGWGALLAVLELFILVSSRHQDSRFLDRRVIEC